MVDDQYPPPTEPMPAEPFIPQITAPTDIVPVNAALLPLGQLDCFRDSDAQTLRGAFNAFVRPGSCTGGPGPAWYRNQCAHYLSDAFIRAGFTELQTTMLIQKRCTAAKRPIVAQDMYRWFQNKKVRFVAGMPPMKSGVWAVYQEYEGYRTGHVVLLDMDPQIPVFQGTNPEWYPWPVQYNYQW